MCRIWGISYGPGGPDAEGLSPAALARRMFPELVMMGPHAWGWMSWDGAESNPIRVSRFKGRADSKAAKKLMNVSREAKWVVGHTRFATHGSADDMKNNHPIRHGRVIGVHNGIISNYREILSVTGRHTAGTQVDSEAIFASVHHLGHARGLAAVRGDAAVAYVHEDFKRSLRVARSNGRPLFVAHTKAGSTIFASEARAIRRSGLHLAAAPKEVTAENVMFILRDGQLTNETQFAVPVVKAWKTASTSSSRAHTPADGDVAAWVDDDRVKAWRDRKKPVTAGGVSGITDYFDQQAALPAGVVPVPQPEWQPGEVCDADDDDSAEYLRGLEDGYDDGWNAGYDEGRKMAEFTEDDDARYQRWLRVRAVDTTAEHVRTNRGAPRKAKKLTPTT